MHPMPDNTLMSVASIMAVSFTAALLGIIPLAEGIYNLLAINPLDLNMFFFGLIFTSVGSRVTYWCISVIIPSDPS